MRDRSRPGPDVSSVPSVSAGSVNAHTHLYSGLASLGMPVPDPRPREFVQILECIWWRLDRAHDPQSLRAAARLYIAEALLSGTTGIIDHHESPSIIEGSLDILADACQELGIRAVLCYGATERNGGRDEARRGLAECRQFILANRRPLVRGVVGLHASFTVSDETIREAAEICRELDTVLHVHLAEDRADLRDAQGRGDRGPLERLIRLNALPRGSILAHGVHLDEDQVRQTEALGCWIVQNPRSNLGNGVGYPAALGASRHVALGTDGYPSVMHEEVRVLMEQARVHGESKAAVGERAGAGRALLGERFAGAARAIESERVAGATGEGPEDDRVVSSPTGVHEVVIAGRTVARHGRLLSADLAEIRSTAAVQSALLHGRMACL